MHELLMKVAGMRLKSDFSVKMFVLRSIGNELVPLPHKNESKDAGILTSRRYKQYKKS